MNGRLNSLGIASKLAIFTLLIASCQFTSAQSPRIQDAKDVREFSNSELDFFENKIRPLLVEHCLECHGANEDKIRGGLWMNSRDQLLKGGDSGAAINPGRPEKSLLISALHYEEFEMPPKGKLDGEKIALLEKWIAMGAPDTRKSDKESSAKPIDLDTGRMFWSFQPVNFQAPPPDRQDHWSLSPIDRFIKHRLNQAGLKPNQDANRYQLLRRVHFALTGLPPAEDEIETFVSSQRPLEDDLSNVVNTLLDSPHFGERWGRHWLDVARFAESSGGGRSLVFPEAWRYRDYVIQAYQDDKPFDQMVVEQIAGDLLPFQTQSERNQNLTAVGFLALGPTNYEQQDKALLRMEVIDEQVDTVGRAFLGMTLGCARCHDHKFDPIPTEDYYALAGIFGSTVSLVDGNVSSYVTQTLATEAEKKQAKQYAQRLKRLTDKEKKIKNQINKLGGRRPEPDSQKVVQRESLDGIVIDNRQAKLIGTWKPSVHFKPFVDQNYIHDDGQPKGANKAIFRPQLETGGNYEVRLSYSPGGNRASNTLVIIDHQDGKKTIRLNQTQAGTIDGLFVSLGTYRFEADNVAQVTISNQETDGVVIADAVQFLKVNDALAANGSSTAKENPAKTNNPSDKETGSSEQNFSEVKQSKTKNPKLEKLLLEQKNVLHQLSELKSNAPHPLAKAMSVKDHPEPKDGHVHIRGNVRQLGNVVPRGFLQVVSKPESWPKIPENSSGRLELARWIASSQNPLTARVYVNRVWRHLFGKGLVETTDNFGEMGMRPSHPELLNYLAEEFVRDGWSTKKLIRKIMLSRVYRLSTNLESVQRRTDPENRLLWRANRRGMEAEVLRDSILFASGQLDLKPGGLTIRKITKYDHGYAFDTRKRSVYVPAFRNSMLDLFEVFDMANPNMVTGHRNTSTLPTQALFLMNSPWVMEQASSMAKLVCQKCDNENDRLELVFLRLLGRPPSNSEKKLAMEYLESLRDQDEKSRWQYVIHATIGCLDFRYIN